MGRRKSRRNSRVFAHREIVGGRVSMSEQTPVLEPENDMLLTFGMLATPGDAFQFGIQGISQQIIVNISYEMNNALLLGARQSIVGGVEIGNQRC
jgi:hypothetical protein